MPPPDGGGRATVGAPSEDERVPVLDPVPLQRILAPFEEASAWTVVIEDVSGATIAGRPPTGPPLAGERPADRVTIGAVIVVDGSVVGRVVGTAPHVDRAAAEVTIEAVARATGELVRESHARLALAMALRNERATAIADTLGIDATELARGRRQQRRILSLVPPDVRGYDLASHYEAAREIGGDFFELFRLRQRGHPLAIVVADVTGKGLDAALLMAFARPVMHGAFDASGTPAEALRRTNRILVEEERGTLFITTVAASLELRTGRIRIANAGHEPPWLIPADGGPITALGGSGVLLGLQRILEPAETEATLEPGDVLVFYTDGVTDALAPSGERFGEDRLRATVEAARGGSAHDVVAAVRGAVEAFQIDAEPADDVTIVAVGRRPSGSRPIGRGATAAQPRRP